MYCTKDCNCSLCRELRGFKPAKQQKRPAPRPPAATTILGRLNENFILRRRAPSSLKSFQPQSLKCSEMLADPPSLLFENSRLTATPSPTPISQPPEPVTPLFGRKRTGSNNNNSSNTSNSCNSETTAAADIAANNKNNNKNINKTNHKVVIYFGDSIANRANRHGGNVAAAATTTTTATATALENKVEQKEIVESENDTLPSYIESIQNGVINIRIEGNYQRASALVETVSKPTRAKVRKYNADTEELDAVEDAEEGDDATTRKCESCDWSFVQEWRSRPANNVRNDVQSNNSGPGPGVSSTATATHASMHNASISLASSHAVSTSTGRIQSPAMATPAQRIPKELAQRPTPSGACASTVSSPSTPFVATNPFHTTAITPQKPNTAHAILTPPSSGHNKQVPQRSVMAPARLTVQSTPVKSQPPMLSTSLSQQQKAPEKAAVVNSGNSVTLSGGNVGIPTDNKNYQQTPVSSKHTMNNRTHHHEFRALHRLQECQSSSDENRSSGHASMSDTGGHGSSSPGGGIALGPLPEDRLAAGVGNRSTRSRASTNHSRVRHRATPAKAPWGGGNGVEDIKAAIHQLTLRSQTSTSTYSSLSAGSESSEPARRLNRFSSLETVNTNVTNADEFVWVDSHNRLMELQHPPWSLHCITRVVRNGRCKDHSERIPPDTMPRLGYLLQRALVRIAREVQRLSFNIGLCSKQEVSGAFKIVLCPALADSCIKNCLRAAAMFAVPGDSALKQSKSARAGLHLPVGKFHRWMVDSRLGKFIHEYAAVYMTAGMENLLEEIVLQCLPCDVTVQLSPTMLENTIAASGDFWGLLQPFAHLNAGRTASGTLTMPRWESQASLGIGTAQSGSAKSNVSQESCLLTTCVGNINELKDLILRTQQKFQYTAMSNAALSALFYFMRCSQLELSEVIPHTSTTSSGTVNTGTQHVQELCYERAYVVLPPLVEWLRVASAHAEYRSAIMIDKDDIMQAARLLLPGVDVPARPMHAEEELPKKRLNFLHTAVNEDVIELGRRATLNLAFKLMLTGRAELLAQAAQILPPTTRYDTLNHAGMTALMIASLSNDEIAIQALLDAGCDPNIEVPAVGTFGCPAIQPDTQYWTAVTFAACRANFLALRVLLDRGGRVEGGARLSEEKLTLTPLQVACGTGSVEIVSLLLKHGANAFLATQQKDSLCFAGSAQRGCFSAISVAAVHGQRTSLHKLLSHPISSVVKEVLSLEEMLAEGDTLNARNGANGHGERAAAGDSAQPALNKAQIKTLQEAMYHSAENNHLDITIELRALGVPWTLHCWMHALSAAHDLNLESVIDQLLQDFLQVCPDDYSAQFCSECLPLLFNIFRYSKNEGTTLLLADIFATCFGREPIKPIKEAVQQPISASRIDPKFVNNPELSDVTFRVEGRIFYGHKIVLVTASPCFQSMLSAKLSEGNTPTVQINEIRYNIFQLVMQYLYSGGCSSLEVQQKELLELMAGASFFQLDGLLRYTEARCSEIMCIDNVVAMYIHSKVYHAHKLLEYCQSFLLQNMVALLTYDDSVKRLFFAKKIPNHDVLSGLLSTLQQRIKQRKTCSVGNFRQQFSTPSSMSTSSFAANRNNSQSHNGIQPKSGSGSLGLVKK